MLSITPRRLAWRYLCALPGHYQPVARMARISVIGMALAVTVLITVLSVMNGFRTTLQQRMLSMTPAMTLSSPMIQEQAVLAWAHQHPEITALASFVEGQLLAQYQDRFQGVMVTGINPEEYESVVPVMPLMQGYCESLLAGRFYIWIGAGLARTWQLEVGDQLMLISPQWTTTLLGAQPKTRRVTVAGIFRSGFWQDQHSIFMHQQDAQALLPQVPRGWAIQLDDPWQAPERVQAWQTDRPIRSRLVDWSQQYQPYFQAIQTEKRMMSWVLSFILALATFNMVSLLTLLIQEKRHDFAILQAMGASPGWLKRVIYWKGGMVLILGIVLGVLCGCGLSMILPQVAATIEDWLGIQWFATELYWIDFLPATLIWSDVFLVILYTFLLGGCAMWYAARALYTLHPAEVLVDD